MKLLRILLAVMSGLCGGACLLAGGVGVWFIATGHSRIVPPPAVIWVVIIGVIFAGGYLLVFAVRLGASKGPLIAAVTPGQQVTAQRYWAVMNFWFAVLYGIGGGGEQFLPRFLIAGGVLFLTGHLLIGLHELGHLFAALAVGATPVLIRIGVGRDLLSFKLGKLQWEIGLWPVSGFFKALPANGKWERPKLLIFVLGGPLASLAAFLAALWLYQHVSIFITLQQPSAWKLAALVLLAHSVWLFLCTLSTADASFDGQLIKSDMTLILKCLFAPDAEVQNIFSGQQRVVMECASPLALWVWR